MRRQRRNNRSTKRPHGWSRREFIEARLDYWKAVFDLERALGAMITDVEGRGE